MVHAQTNLSYEAIGATSLARDRWEEYPAGYRRHELTVGVGHGQLAWDHAAEDVMRWAVKTRSGFSVGTSADKRVVRSGSDFDLIALFGPIQIREPVRVVEVVDQADRCGFAYGTRHGHPISGEEAFVVHRSADDSVWLTIRSLTRPAPGIRCLLYPIALLLQPLYRKRYMRSLGRPGEAGPV